MATPTTVARFSNALKILQPEKIIRKHGMMNQAFWAYLPKTEDFGGRKAVQPVQVSTGGRGNSHTFDDAQESAGGGDFVEFEYERVKDYKICTFDNEALEASENDKGGYLSLKKMEIEGNLDVIVQRLGADLQSVDGNCGVVAAVSTSNNTIDIPNYQAVGLEIGSRLQAAATPFTSLRPGGPVGYVVVKKIAIGGGGAGIARLTLDVTASDGGDTVTQSGIIATDRLYIKGNFGKSLISTEQWIPTDRSNLGTTFHGVDRSVYDIRLAGYFFDGSSYGLAETFERGLAEFRLTGKTVDTVWLSVNRFQDLSLDLGAKGERETFNMAGFGYDSIKVISAGGKGGSVRFMCDPNFTDSTALGTTKESWKFRSLNGAPRNLTRRAGTELIIEPARDGWQIRHGWYGNLVCTSPGENCRFTLPT